MLRALIPPKGKLIPFFFLFYFVSQITKSEERTKREVARDGAGKGSIALQGWLRCREKGRTPPDAFPWGASLGRAGCSGPALKHLPGQSAWDHKGEKRVWAYGRWFPALEVNADICPVQPDRQGETVPITQGPEPLLSLFHMPLGEPNEKEMGARVFFPL